MSAAKTTITAHSKGEGRPKAQNPKKATIPWQRGTMIMACSTAFTVLPRWSSSSVSCPRVNGEMPRSDSRRSSPSRSRKNNIIRKIVRSRATVATPVSTTCT